MRKIAIATGTRADWGLLSGIARSLRSREDCTVAVLATNMHLHESYGFTVDEIVADGFTDVRRVPMPDTGGTPVGTVESMAECMSGMARELDSIRPDLLVILGDRFEMLATATAALMLRVPVVHLHGGEISEGAVDDSIRHAVSKFAHLHFVCNEEAKKRIIQLGESEKHIFVIGSPDIDIMLGNHLPSVDKAKTYYDITFEEYAIFMYHPVTTEVAQLGEHIKKVIEALRISKRNYIVIYPNNDLGTEIILENVRKLDEEEHFAVYPSLRFEYFLTLLRHAQFIIGNSSAGIRESGIYGVPAVDIGTRQEGRYDQNTLKNVQHVEESVEEITEAIRRTEEHAIRCHNFGLGNSTEKFLQILDQEDVWKCEVQKRFVDLS